MWQFFVQLPVLVTGLLMCRLTRERNATSPLASSSFCARPELRAVVEARGAKLLFLAPYSPIGSLIGPAFNCFKSFWVRHAEMLAGMLTGDASQLALYHCYEDPAHSARLSFVKFGCDWQPPW